MAMKNSGRPFYPCHRCSYISLMKMIIMYQMVCGSVGASPRCTVARAFHRILYGHYVVCTYAMGSSVAERMADGCNGYQARN
jgi:hypothetical protein